MMPPAPAMVGASSAQKKKKKKKRVTHVAMRVSAAATRAGR
jgi:hypothetical protein